MSGFPLIVGAMIYRYRPVSTPVERQQTKWVVLGVGLLMGVFMAWFVPQIILYGSLSPAGSVYDLIGHPLWVIAAFILPICLAIAILRYRLWDIDTIINKALVYGSLTGLLGVLYAGLIIGARELDRAGGRNDRAKSRRAGHFDTGGFRALPTCTQAYPECD